jgi:hypothetical protein
MKLRCSASNPARSYSGHILGTRPFVFPECKLITVRFKTYAHNKNGIGTFAPQSSLPAPALACT